jgi:WD40 repeat protein
LTSPCDTVRSLAFSPASKLLAAACANGQVVFWSIPAGEKRLEWQLRTSVHAVAFAADGRHVATGNGNGTV